MLFPTTKNHVRSKSVNKNVNRVSSLPVKGVKTLDIPSNLMYNVYTESIIMKTDKNFKMRKTTKQMLTNLFGQERTAFKNLMIDSQVSFEKNAKASLKKVKVVNNE